MIALVKRGKMDKPIKLFDNWYKACEWTDKNIKVNIEEYYFQRVWSVRLFWFKLLILLKMKTGTKSILFGAHCFFIHPTVVAIAWTKLYGFPFDPRLWIAFFVHDLGYWGKPNMDGPEGETHVELGAKIMSVFGKKWADFSRYHSRFYAKKDGVSYSRLCVADKLAICLEPPWLYLPRVNWTGEVDEYMALAADREVKYASMRLSINNQLNWFNDMRRYLRKWVVEHRDGREDIWTPEI